MNENGNHSDMYKELIGAKVLVRMNNDIEFSGILEKFDGHKNIKLTDAKELLDGDIQTNLGVAYIRGSNIVFISPNGDKKF